MSEAGPAMELGFDEVHVWVTDPDCEAIRGDPPPYLAWLSDDERRRFLRYRFGRDRRLYLAAHAQVRAVLSQYDRGTAPAAWRFHTKPHGRPEIAVQCPENPLYFNLSHTRGAVVSAVARTPDVGVDVEHIERRVDVRGVARATLTPEEFQALAALPEETRQARFFEYWTLKEAFVKAQGVGLAFPLNRLRIEDRGAAGIVAVPEAAPGSLAPGWHLEKFQPTPLHRAAVAARLPGGGSIRVSIRRFPL